MGTKKVIAKKVIAKKVIAKKAIAKKVDAKKVVVKKVVAKKIIAKKANVKVADAKVVVAKVSTLRTDSADFRTAAVNLQSAFAQMFLFFTELCAHDSSGVPYVVDGPDKDVVYDDEEGIHTRTWLFGEQDHGGVKLSFEMEGSTDITFSVVLANGEAITPALLEASKFQEVQQAVVGSYNTVLKGTGGYWFCYKGDQRDGERYIKSLETAAGGNLSRFVGALLEEILTPTLQDGKITFDDVECSSFYGRASWSPFLLHRFLGRPELSLCPNGDTFGLEEDDVKEIKDHVEEKSAIRVPSFVV